MVHIPATFADSWDMAKHYAKTAFVGKTFLNKPDDVLAAMQYGAELGFYPLAIFRQLFLLPSGQWGMMAQGLHGVAVTQPGCEYFRRDDDKSERGKKEVWVCKNRMGIARGEFSLKDADTAGLLSNDIWKKYPADMLENRAIARCARRACPERLAGMYTREEVESVDMVETVSGHFEAPTAPAVEPDVVGAAFAEAVRRSTPAPEPEAADLPPAEASGAVSEYEQLCALISEAETGGDLENINDRCRKFKERDPVLGKDLLKRYVERRKAIQVSA